MPLYRIYRMKDGPRQQFRSAPHVTGCASVKRKDYDAGATIEARSEYEAWGLLRGAETPLAVGDVLENEQGELRICKYVGFDTAQWAVPEHKPPATEESCPTTA